MLPWPQSAPKPLWLPITARVNLSVSLCLCFSSLMFYPLGYVYTSDQATVMCRLIGGDIGSVTEPYKQGFIGAHNRTSSLGFQLLCVPVCPV